MAGKLTIVSDKGNSLGGIGRTATKAAVLNPATKLAMPKCIWHHKFPVLLTAS
jgi:hypothetical protein